MLTTVDPKSPLPPGKKEAVFIAITVWCDIYANYEDPSMSPERRKALYPLVLMSYRWDGKLGFIGGMCEPGESHVDTIRRESFEEIGIPNTVPSRLKHVVSHETDSIRVHLYQVANDIASLDQLRSFLSWAAIIAKHSISEGSVIWAHLADYGKGKGWETLINSQLSAAVKEELIELKSQMMTNAPEGAFIS